jgi:O-antigen/teichoic acid export membrane protein
VAYLTLVDLGFGVALNRYLAQATASNDWRTHFGNVFTIGRAYFLVTNSLLAVLILILARHLDTLVAVSPETAADARRGLYILAAWTLVRSPFAVYGAALSATQNLAAANLSALAGNIVRFAAAAALLMAGWGVTGLIAAIAMSEAATFILQWGLFRRRFPSLEFGWRFGETRLAREMLLFGGSTFMLTIGARLTFNADSIMVGALFDARTASLYYTTQMPAFLAFTVIYRLVASAEPAINELYARGQQLDLRDLYVRLQRYTLIASIGAAFGFLFLGEALIEAWLGPGQFAGKLMASALSAFIVVITLSNIDYVFLIAQGRVRALSRIVLAEAVANIGLSIVLANTIGYQGVMLATLIAVTPRAIYQSHMVRAMLTMSVFELTAKSLKPMLIPTALGCIWLLATRWLVGIGTWPSLMLSTVGYALTYGVAISVFALTSDERAMARTQARRITRFHGRFSFGGGHP